MPTLTLKSCVFALVLLIWGCNNAKDPEETEKQQAPQAQSSETIHTLETRVATLFNAMANAVEPHKEDCKAQQDALQEMLKKQAPIKGELRQLAKKLRAHGVEVNREVRNALLAQPDGAMSVAAKRLENAASDACPRNRTRLKPVYQISGIFESPEDIKHLKEMLKTQKPSGLGL